MDTVTSADGTWIAFDRYGDGPPLILVDGAFQHRAFDPGTARLAEVLSADLSVIHYDRRGRGDSGDTAPYSTAREIEDIDALVERAGGSAGLFGHSSGAVLALDAVAAGVRATRVAVYDPTVAVGDSRPPVPPDHLVRLRASAGGRRRGDAVEMFLTEGVGVPAHVVASMRAMPLWPRFERVAHTLAYDAEIVDDLLTGAPLTTARWASVTVPVLAIDGGASPAWLRRAADAVAAVLPDARRTTLPDQDHGPEAESLAPVLRRFFES